MYGKWLQARQIKTSEIVLLFSDKSQIVKNNSHKRKTED